MFAIIAAIVTTLYGLANVVFAFVPAPSWLEPRLGPDRRTRRLLSFLPADALEKTGRVIYGVACLALAALLFGLSFFYR